jgi:ATP/maltotriose-dependent transcriptional regulator MalT
MSWEPTDRLQTDHVADLLERARGCAGAGSWSSAFAYFASADRLAALQTDDLERWSVSAYLSGYDREFQHILERLHRTHLETGNRPAAARSAFWLGFSLLLRGELAQSNAWLAHGGEHIKGQDCVEKGYLLLPVAEHQLLRGEAEAAQATAAEAGAIGDRWCDADLIAAARHVRGRALIQQGQVLSGLTLLDQTMLTVVAGELSPMMTGLLYCSVIEACRDVHAIGRAREWTSALSRWCERQSEMVAFTGSCLVHRAAIMQFHGAWPDALSEACRACERAERVERKPPGAALYQQGEIYRLRGEYSKADAAYRHASQLGFEPQPGLSLLRLAEGQGDAAAAAMRRLLIATTEPFRRARLLPAHIEIMLATGDAEEARRACQELDTIADTCDTDILRAVTRQAHGAIALSQNDAKTAIGLLRCAFELWARVEAPYETARVRVLLGQACRMLGDEETAVLEFQAARTAFDELGAQPDRARLDGIASSKHSTAGPLTSREREVLTLIAAGRTNKAIAEALCLSERTIDRHVSNILTKLDVPSRAAATAYAYVHRLL